MDMECFQNSSGSSIRNNTLKIISSGKIFKQLSLKFYSVADDIPSLALQTITTMQGRLMMMMFSYIFTFNRSKSEH